MDGLRSRHACSLCIVHCQHSEAASLTPHLPESRKACLLAMRRLTVCSVCQVAPVRRPPAPPYAALLSNRHLPRSLAASGCTSVRSSDLGPGNPRRPASLSAGAGGGAQEKGNSNAHWWAKHLLAALGPASWTHVGLRQLSGMLVLVFVRQVPAPLPSLNPKPCPAPCAVSVLVRHQYTRRQRLRLLDSPCWFL